MQHDFHSGLLAIKVS